MEDIEHSGVIAPGSGIIVTCDEDKYIGFLMATDDVYLYLKVTHRWELNRAEVTEDSKVELRALLGKRPEWLLHLQVAWKYKVITVGMDKDRLTDLLANAIENDALDAEGPVGAYVQEAKAVNMGIPHDRIDTFESLQDVMAGTMLAELDFTLGLEDNGRGDDPDEDD